MSHEPTEVMGMLSVLTLTSALLMIKGGSRVLTAVLVAVEYELLVPTVGCILLRHLPAMPGTLGHPTRPFLFVPRVTIKVLRLDSWVNRVLGRSVPSRSMLLSWPPRHTLLHRVRTPGLATFRGGARLVFLGRMLCYMSWPSRNRF